jgi:hypothetical protein
MSRFFTFLSLHQIIKIKQTKSQVFCSLLILIIIDMRFGVLMEALTLTPPFTFILIPIRKVS